MAPSHLFLQMEPGEAWCLGPVFAVTESLGVSLQCRSRDRPVELELLSTLAWTTVQMELLSTPMMSLLVPRLGLLAAWVARKQRACLACCRQAIETKELPCSQMPSRFGFSDSVPTPDQAELGDVKGSQKRRSQAEGEEGCGWKLGGIGSERRYWAV